MLDKKLENFYPNNEIPKLLWLSLKSFWLEKSLLAGRDEKGCKMDVNGRQRTLTCRRALTRIDRLPPGKVQSGRRRPRKVRCRWRQLSTVNIDKSDASEQLFPNLEDDPHQHRSSSSHPGEASTLLSDVRSRSAPALELVAVPRSGEPHISRAASSVGVMYCVSGPNTGSNPGGERIQKKKKKPETMKFFYFSKFRLFKSTIGKEQDGRRRP